MATAEMPRAAGHVGYRSAWVKAWGGVVVLAFVNGAFHEGYQGALGELRAEQLSSVVLLLMLAPWVRWVEQRHRLPTTRAAVTVGLGWALATVVFEFVFFHHLGGQSWAELLGAYNVLEGRLWTFDVLGIAALPALARGWRIRR